MHNPLRNTLRLKRAQYRHWHHLGRLRQRWHSVWLVGLILLLMGSLTACGGGGAGKLLVWTGEGVSPDQKANGQPGQIAYIDADGKLEALLEVPAEAAGVMICGEQATSPDGRRLALLVNIAQGGRDGGTLYQITDTGKPVEVGPAHAMTCSGSGSLQYTPDSQQLAYLDFDEPGNADYASGTLRIFKTDPAGTVIASYERVGAFHAGSSATEFLQYYASNQNLVDEIAVMIHENTGAKEIATLFADANCRYTGASITPAGGKIALLVGHRCSGGTTWQLYTVNRDGGELTLALSGTPDGGFFPTSRTASLITGTDDQYILFTSPDGITRNTVSLLTASMKALTEEQLSTLVERGVVMPHYTPRSFTLPENALPVFSPNRRWWGMVTADTRSPAAITVVDLASTAKAPITAPSADRSDTISTLLFTPNNEQVLFVSGGSNGKKNTLAKLTLADGKVTAIATGTYGSGVLALDGSTLAFNIWQKAGDTRETPYQNLALVNPADGSVTKVLYQGIRYEADGTTIEGRQFAFPLAYRR